MDKLVALQALYHISLRLSVITNIETILAETMAHLTPLTGADRAAIFAPTAHEAAGEGSGLLPDPPPFHLIASHNLSPSFYAALGGSQGREGRAFPWAVEAFRTREPRVVSDCLTDPACTPWRDLAQGEGYAAVAALPLSSGSQCLGVLSLYYPEPHTFDDDEMQFLVSFANLIALALVNARLYAVERRRVAESEALQSIAAALATKQEVGEILTVVCREAQRLTGAEGAAVLLTEDREWLHVAAQTGEVPLVNRPIPVRHSLNGASILRGEALISNDAAHDPRVYHSALGQHFQSIMCAPLLTKRGPLGSIALVNKEGGFDANDARIITLLASQAAIAIENARLLGDLRRSEEQYRQLTENAAEVIFSLNPQGVFTFVSRRVVDVLGYSPDELIGQSIGTLLDPESMELVLEHLRQSLYDPTYRATYELPVHRRNGEHAYLEVSVTSVCRDGAVVGQQAIARDVSEKKALEAEVARRTRELQISRERQEELRTYMTLVTRAIEEERKRVARELHDDTAQSLVALTRSLDALGLSLAGSAGHATARQRIEEVRAIAESILASIRRFSRDLRPSLLDDLGLVAALEWLASETQRLTGITAVCEVHGEERRLEPDVELALFRIAQEALSNVRRHAQAVHAWVTIIFGDGFVQLDVRDDGIGFVPVERPADLASARGLGLRGMRERAQIIGAEFAVQSAPGAGTTVRVRVRG